MRGSTQQAREMKRTAARLYVGIGGASCQGKYRDPRSGDVRSVFASAKNQLCDLGSDL